MSANTYTLANLIQEVANSATAETYTAIVAVVESYDPATCTCTCTPAVKRPVPQTDGEYATDEMPTLQDVPVLFAVGGGFRIAFPLAPGDAVLLVCPTIHPGAYLASGQVGIDPGIGDLHSLGGAFAMPGVVTYDKTEAGPDHLALTKKDGASVHVDDDVKLGSPTAADYVALASKVDANLNAIKDLLAGGLTVTGSSVSGGTVTGTAKGTFSPTEVAATKVKAV